MPGVGGGQRGWQVRRCLVRTHLPLDLHVGLAEPAVFNKQGPGVLPEPYRDALCSFASPGAACANSQPLPPSLGQDTLSSELNVPSLVSKTPEEHFLTG